MKCDDVLIKGRRFSGTTHTRDISISLDSNWLLRFFHLSHIGAARFSLSLTTAKGYLGTLVTSETTDARLAARGRLEGNGPRILFD